MGRSLNVHPCGAIVSQEGRDNGSRLVLGVEELPSRESVDVVATYQLPTNAANSFWTWMGYTAYYEGDDSNLHREEVDLEPPILQHEDDEAVDADGGRRKRERK